MADRRIIQGSAEASPRLLEKTLEGSGYFNHSGKDKISRNGDFSTGNCQGASPCKVYLQEKKLARLVKTFLETANLLEIHSLLKFPAYQSLTDMQLVIEQDYLLNVPFDYLPELLEMAEEKAFYNLLTRLQHVQKNAYKIPKPVNGSKIAQKYKARESVQQPVSCAQAA